MCRQCTRTASTEDWVLSLSIARSAITEDMGEDPHGSRPLDIQSLWRQSSRRSITCWIESSHLSARLVLLSSLCPVIGTVLSTRMLVSKADTPCDTIFLVDSRFCTKSSLFFMAWMVLLSKG